MSDHEPNRGAAGAERTSSPPLSDATVRSAEQATERLPRGSDISALRLLIRMVQDAVAGKYPKLPWPALALAVFGILYLVNPADAIPDPVPFVGYADDAAVVAGIVEALGRELERYRAWLSTRS